MGDVRMVCMGYMGVVGRCWIVFLFRGDFCPIRFVFRLRIDLCPIVLGWIVACVFRVRVNVKPRASVRGVGKR